MRSLSTELIHLLLQWPFWVILALASAALRSWFRMAEWGSRLGLTILTVAAYGVSAPASANALLVWIESRETVPDPAVVNSHGVGGAPRILVLSAGWFRTTPHGHVVVMGAASWERTAAAVALWHQVGGQLLFTGAPLPDGSDSVASHMARAARDWGVPAVNVRVEARSTTTQENIAFSAQAFGLNPGTPVVLVTSALNMPRALLAARAAGWNVLPYPCDFRADTAMKWQHFLPANEGPGAFEDLAHEALGWILYRLRGWA